MLTARQKSASRFFASAGPPAGQTVSQHDAHSSRPQKRRECFDFEAIILEQMVEHYPT